MASNESNLITRVNSSSNNILVNSSSLSRFTLSISSAPVIKPPVATTRSTFSIKTTNTSYIPTPLTDVTALGFFSMSDYIQYLNRNNIPQTISVETIGKIKGSYGSTGITLEIQLEYKSHPNLYFTIFYANRLNINNNVINSLLEAKVSGYVLAKKIDDLPQAIIIGQGDLRGLLNIKLDGVITSSNLKVNISGIFTGDFTGTVNGQINSNSGFIDQDIFINISHTNYLVK